MHVLIFIPNNLQEESPGYLFGSYVHDKETDIAKFYVIGTITETILPGEKTTNNVIGFYFSSERSLNFSNVRLSNWLNLNNHGQQKYSLRGIFIDNQKVDTKHLTHYFIIYDQDSMRKAELTSSYPGEHFSRMKEILEVKDVHYGGQSRSILVNFYETVLVWAMCAIFYPVLIGCKAMDLIGRISKYSTLGNHLNTWFRNLKWMSSTVIANRKFSLKTGNLLLAMIFDIILGIFVLELILNNIKDRRLSFVMLENAEKVVNFLQSLINWLMGSPAGLKLNHSFNSTLGKFFLYHIHLWWTFLKVIQPVMEFAFKILLMVGTLGITFQISIIADLLALISFHTYCIYVYAARLFNIQLKGLIALFRLFLGKKKNPLRERVDSCEYQANQLFIGTLFFTILLFLMPTTWVYYTVFSTMRLILIGLSGFLMRLRFYIQVIPIYSFLHWIFGSQCIKGDYYIDILPESKNGPVTLSAEMVSLSWSETWRKCIPDTMSSCPPIKWGEILGNLWWGELLYPL